MEQSSIKKTRLLLCAIPTGLEGGIGAVVFGLEEGFRLSDVIEWKRIVYGRSRAVIGTFHRIISELIQMLHYIWCIITFMPDVVLVETSFDKKTVFRDSIHLYIAYVFRRAFVVHAHGGEWHLIPRWSRYWQYLADNLLRRSSAVVVTSKAEEDIIRSIYGNTVNVKRIFNPIVIPVSIRRKDFSHKKPVIVFASRLINTKGISDVIEAMNLLRDVPCELRIFGSGPIESAMQKRTIELQLQDRISFCGQVTIERLLAEYAECDLYLFPSYHLEGFPMSVFFALAMGVPLIATRVRPLPEYLEEPKNCLWVNERDKKMLAEKIRIILSSPEMRISMSEANKKITEQFDPIVVANKFICVFDDCIRSIK